MGLRTALVKLMTDNPYDEQMEAVERVLKEFAQINEILSSVGKMSNTLENDQMQQSLELSGIRSRLDGLTKSVTTNNPVGVSINWQLFPAWAKWIAIGDNGVWFWYSELPAIAGECWGFSGDGTWGVIPAQYCPVAVADKDALFRRPNSL